MLEATDPILIRHLAPKNFLSFGPDTSGIDLRSLNVLIGPNGSGKSNMIEAINFMRAAPRDIRVVIRKGGGVGEWIWKGRSGYPASVEWLVSPIKGEEQLRHQIAFNSVQQGFSVENEGIEKAYTEPGKIEAPPYYSYQNSWEVNILERGGTIRSLAPEIDSDQSILA